MMKPTVYPNAPVVLVALHIRCVMFDQILPPQARNAIGRVLSRHGFEVAQGGTAFRDSTSALGREVWQWHTSDRRTAFTVRSTGLSVETTAYSGFDDFKELAKVAMTCLSELPQPLTILRIGLRYINEIRPHSLTEDEVSWSDWVDSSLLPQEPAPQRSGLTLLREVHSKFFSGQSGERVTLRYGARTGTAFISSYKLRRRHFENGPFFLIDIDSFRLTEIYDPDVRSVERKILEEIDSLHDVAEDTFNWAVTDAAKKEIFNNEN